MTVNMYMMRYYTCISLHGFIPVDNYQGQRNMDELINSIPSRLALCTADHIIMSPLYSLVENS